MSSERLPNTEAERWRFVEQKTRQFAIDIDRLWRQMQTLSKFGESAPDGGIDPNNYTDPAGTSCPNKKIISIWGNPSAGTITLSISGHSCVLNYNSSNIATATALTTAAGYPVAVLGGTFPNNDQTVVLPDGETLTLTSFSLTRSTGSWAPHARVDS